MRIARRCTLLLLALVSPRASAQLLDDSGFVPKSSDTRLRFWAIEGGLRGGYSPTTASAPAHGAFGVSRTVGMKFPLTLAIGARLDLGATRAAKTDDASGFSQRLLGALELRRHARSRDGFWFARLGLGGAHDRRGLGLGAEASVGGAVSFAELDEDPTEHLPRFWLAPEAGLAWSPSHPGAAGPFARLTVTMSF